MLSKTKIKYLISLKNKKFRYLNRQFIMEGDKIVHDALFNKNATIREIIALPDWFSTHRNALSGFKGEIHEADSISLGKITTLETPPPVMAVMDFFSDTLNEQEIAYSCSLALDTIQDPGNLGTIIRTADWFGIRNILCNQGCADMYNPKVIQASMGAILNVGVHYVDLAAFMSRMKSYEDFEIRGAYMQGDSLYHTPSLKKGLMVFGNESKGISDAISEYIHHRITIPPANAQTRHVESLNVASSVAIVLALLHHTG